MKLERVLDGDLCSGCGLCTAILGEKRARMALDSDGYLRPQIETRLAEAEALLIDRVCPGGQLEFVAGDAPFATVWGPVIDVHTGFASDQDLRFKASSGGVTSAIAQ